MPRVCSVCASPDRAAIEEALVGTMPIRQIAATWKVSRNGVALHRDEHLPEVIAKSHQAAEAVRADGLLADLAEVRAVAFAVMRSAVCGSLPLPHDREGRLRYDLLVELVDDQGRPLLHEDGSQRFAMPDTALRAVREAGRVLELAAKVQGQLPAEETEQVLRVVFDEAWRTGQ